MGRNRLSPADKASRIIQRDNLKQEREESKGKIRTWLSMRAQAAADAREERKQERALTDANLRAQAFKVDRTLPVEFVVPPTGTSVVNGRTVYGNHAERRQQGARGHKRRPRARELPGAEARRLERNRRANIGAW